MTLGRQLRLIHRDVRVEVHDSDVVLESGSASELVASTSFYSCFVRVLKVDKKKKKKNIISKIKRNVEEKKNG